MVDHEVDRHGGIDALGGHAARHGGAAEGREVDDDRDAREILEEDPFGVVGELDPLGERAPVSERADIPDVGAIGVEVANDVLEQDPNSSRPSRQADRVDSVQVVHTEDRGALASEVGDLGDTERVGIAHAV